MNTKKVSLKATLITCLATSALALAGCATNSPNQQDSHSGEHSHDKATTHTVAHAEPIPNRDPLQALKVKTSIYPLQYLVERIVGEKLAASSLTGPGVDAHSLELSPKTVAELDQADAVIYLSGFQNAVDDAAAQSQNPRILDISTALNLIEGHAHDHDHGHDHDHKHTDAKTSLDPHFWLDPHQMVKATHELTAFLVKIDPANATQYQENAKRLEADLNQLAEEIHTDFHKCEIKTFVVSHEAFGYLANETGLTQVGVSGLDPEVTPSVARVEEVKRVIKENGVKTIYLEVNVSARVIEALANDLGIEIAVLDPIATQNDPTTDYLQLMRKNLETLKKGQNCQ
ncbi:metal ABC transporter substrate-binding protein [Gleimia sp. 6138-11-ORH1]|uniref:metal ABC transporter substrate-binding protein n=1 Tax=Gleimia sp. 6138-11-ORH1 TaxID=2973937 RepID=UPI00216764E2|nr:metal ABC transporter substrate-binding protein [Gleimia sp. 6138-11-ORH1]MCS4484202.1 metal ABC transporter substrate-binding protein [Gleimia sp. 6138-11-ORH1]